MAYTRDLKSLASASRFESESSYQQGKLMQVTVRNDNINKALSIFKKKCGEVIQEVRDRQHYEKPTTRRNRRKKMAISRERKRQAGDRKEA
jgi:small subunit ribosomal protein S21